MFHKLKSWAKAIKQNIIALYLVLKRKEVPWYKKAFIGLVVGYAISPIDLIPDFIPILGYLDDAILLPLGILLAIRLIPKDVFQACQQEAKEQYVNKKLSSKIAGAIILFIWLLLLVFLSFRFLLPFIR